MMASLTLTIMGIASAQRRSTQGQRAMAFSMPPPGPPLVIHSRRVLALHALLVATAFLFFQAGLQWLLYDRNNQGDMHWATGAVSALCVGALSFWLFDGRRKRRLLHKRRFEAIGEANHHIRNALHAMQFRLYVMKIDSEHMQALQQSVERIRWVLEEVLPEGDR
jgi:hypothetical protein